MKSKRSVMRAIPVFGLMALFTLLFVSGRVLAEGDTVDHGKYLLDNFLAVFIITFGLFTLIAGIFTAYFGAGKSRAIGGVLTLVGLVVLIAAVMMAMKDEVGPLGIIDWGPVAVFDAFITVLGALIGGLVAVVLFLVAIMKS